MCICEKHFNEQCFTNATHKRLNHSAVPRLHEKDAEKDGSRKLSENIVTVSFTYIHM